MSCWKYLSFDEASTLASKWDEVPDPLSLYSEWSKISESLPFFYKSIRSSILDAYNVAFQKYNRDKTGGYRVDLEFGLNVYEFLTKEKNMTPVDAANDDIWRYIQMKIVPDLVMKRWKPKDKNVNDIRFWKDSRRIWIKSLWWYVHLSYQGNIDDTRKILINNTTDEISQLVERPGSGYRVNLCRAIMKRYSESPKHHHNLLRNIMKLNTVKCVTLEPLLFESGIDGYTEELFKYYDA